MKKYILSAVCFTMLVAGLTAGEKKSFGKPLTVKETTKISELLATPEKFNGKKVKVEGAIVDVCKSRGCWINIASDKEFQTIRFKVEDGVIVFPVDLKGKNVTAEGLFTVKTYSVEELIESGKEQAKEAGKEFDPTSVKGPKTVIQLNGEGAQVEIR